MASRKRRTPPCLVRPLGRGCVRSHGYHRFQERIRGIGSTTASHDPMRRKPVQTAIFPRHHSGAPPRRLLCRNPVRARGTSSLFLCGEGFRHNPAHIPGKSDSRVVVRCSHSCPAAAYCPDRGRQTNPGLHCNGSPEAVGPARVVHARLPGARSDTGSLPESSSSRRRSQ